MSSESNPKVPLLPANAIRAGFRPSDKTFHIGEITVSHVEAQRLVIDLAELLHEVGYKLSLGRDVDPAQGWQPIERLLADDDQTIILLGRNETVWFGTSMSRGPATHWMPLPAPPVAAKEPEPQ